jgi:hypothetical protein
MIRPQFNVVEPFQGVIIVQMNDEMGKLLSQFISEVNNVEHELIALGKALQDPLKSRELRDKKRRKKRLEASGEASEESE